MLVALLWRCVTIDKHDIYVESLTRSLSGYDTIRSHVNIIGKRGRPVGEIDVLAIKHNGSCDLFEVKCSHRITKARQQLTKLRKLVSRERPVRNTFFYCGESGELISV